MDENGREYVRTAEIPEWMASTLGKIVPVAIISVMVSGLLVWADQRLLDSRVTRLESFAAGGDRFTRSDGNTLVERIARLETYREKHTQFQYEALSECRERLAKVEDRVHQLEKRKVTDE